ncbi:hypothetical protein ACFLX3_02895 [Chloroflexota bacterium]
MPNINADKLRRAILLLKTLRSNIKDSKEYIDLPESHVIKFHNLLLSISQSGIDVTEFHIPKTELKPSVESVNSVKGNTTYSNDKYVRKSIYLCKLDGIINNLSALLEEPKRSVGFKPKE